MSVAGVPRAALEQAAEWLLRLQEGPLESDQRREFDHWLAASADNARAWQRVERLTATLGGMPPGVASAALDRPDSPARRAALAKLVVLLAVVPVGWGAWRLADSTNRYRSAVGEQRELATADGSQLILNTDTDIAVRFDGRQRLIDLHQGEIHIETSDQPDPRPFRVATEQGRLEALGTRFSVRQLDGETRLKVFAGAVAVSPSGRGPRTVVEAGAQLAFSAARVGAVEAVADTDAAWINGMLMADEMPLAQLLGELARYRHGTLQMDPALAALTVSGAYPLLDSDQALAMLAATYPLRVHRSLFGYWTRVLPKQ